MAFTLVFEGELRDFDLNPFKTETPFGIPRAAGIGNAFEERDRVEEELRSLKAEAL